MARRVVPAYPRWGSTPAVLAVLALRRPGLELVKQCLLEINMDLKPPCDEGKSSLTPLILQVSGLVVTLVGPILLKLLDRFWSRRSNQPPKENQ